LHGYIQVTPKFCKQYAQIGNAINEALVAYREEVASHSFPSAAFSPYKIDQKEVDSFLKQLQNKGLSKAAEAAACSIVSGNVKEE
jgi:3-methyl-2-oxobutanoate hydroxymethyltransferase